jgi:hypothetical protein
VFIYQQPEAKVNEPACLNPEPTRKLDDGKDTRRTHCTPTVGSLSAVYEPLLLCSGTFLSFIPWMQCMSVVPMVRKKHVFQSPSVQVVDPTAARGRASASRSRSTGRCHACPPHRPRRWSVSVLRRATSARAKAWKRRRYPGIPPAAGHHHTAAWG